MSVKMVLDTLFARDKNTGQFKPIPVFAGNIVQNHQRGVLTVFGDSLSVGQNNDDRSYVDILKESQVFTDVKKCARSTAAIGPWTPGTPGAGYSLYEWLTNSSRRPTAVQCIEQSDFIFLQYFANDIFGVVLSNTPIGDYTSAADTSTAAGTFKKCLELIYEIKKDVRVMWLPVCTEDIILDTLAERYYSLVKSVITLADFKVKVKELYKAYRDVCVANSINIVPILQNNGMNTYNADIYVTSDGLHPTEAGHRVIADIVASTMSVPKI